MLLSITNPKSTLTRYAQYSRIYLQLVSFFFFFGYAPLNCIPLFVRHSEKVLIIKCCVGKRVLCCSWDVKSFILFTLECEPWRVALEEIRRLWKEMSYTDLVFSVCVCVSSFGRWFQRGWSNGMTRFDYRVVEGPMLKMTLHIFCKGPDYYIITCYII